MINYEDLIANNLTIQTLPTIFTQLNDTISNPLSTIQDVVNIINKDQTSVATIIKIINSPIYGLVTRVDTVSNAVFYLGFNEVRNVILSLSVLNLFKNTKALNYFNIVDLWKHSIATAVISRLIAQKCRITNLENYFIAGLIHDIGKVVLLNILPEEYAKMLKYVTDNNFELKDVERQKLGITHEIAGEYLSKLWRLPESLKCVIKYHSSLEFSTEYPQLIASVQLADILAHILRLGNSGRYNVPCPDQILWEYLPLSQGDLTRLISEITPIYSESISILHMESK